MRLDPYSPRTIQFLELWEHEGWRMKVYAISEGGEKPHREFVKMAHSLASRTLPAAGTPNCHGLGFIVIHIADMFNQIIVDWWERSNELRHHVFKAEANHPLHFDEITASGEAFCVWELRVIGYEREAWLDTVLDSLDGPEAATYLRRRLNERC